MKKIIAITLASLALCLGLTSCWDDSVPEAGAGRHQVNDLEAVAGDGEVLLSWTLPSGWDADEFIIIWNDVESQTQTLKLSAQECAGASAGSYRYLMTGLVNAFAYTFNVQASYRGAISGQISVKATPKTTRIAVSDLNADAGNARITLTWTKPADNVKDYTLTYWQDGKESGAKDVTIPADKTEYTLSDLENDVNYVLKLVANYANGKSEAVTLKAMPSSATVFFLSSTMAAKNQPITFRFNTADIPTATDISWKFPDGTVLNGAEVSYGIGSVGTQTVTLSAKVNGVAKSWPVEVVIREHVLFTTDFAASGAYNGFKGSYPVFSPDGKTVYNITFSGISGLYAYDLASGTEKWRYIPETASGSYNPLTVNPVNGDIYYGTTTKGQFYCVTSEGSLRWTFTGAGSCQSTSPAVSKDGSTVYLGDATGGVFAIDAASGTKKWNYSAGAKVGCIAVYDSYVIIGIASTNNSVSFLNAADGTLDTGISLAANVTDIAGFGVSPDLKTLYVPQAGGAMSSVNLETKAVIVNSFVFSGNTNYEPIVLPNGHVVTGSKDSSVYCLDKDLTSVVWKFEYLPTGTNNAFNYSHPCCDTQNNVYISAGAVQNQNFVIGPDGAIKDQWQYDGAGNKQMGGNNYNNGVMFSAFIGASGANGLFVGDYKGGQRAANGGPGYDICGSRLIR